MVKNGFAENSLSSLSMSPSIIYEILFASLILFPLTLYSSNERRLINDNKQNLSSLNSSENSMPGDGSIGTHFVPIRLSASMGGELCCCAEIHDSMKLNVPTSKIKSNVLIRIMPPVKNGDTGIYANSGLESNFI